MNSIRTSTWLYVGLLFALVACQAQATPPAPTLAPPTAAPITVLATAAAPAPSFSPADFKIPLTLRFGQDWKVSYSFPGKFAIDNANDFGLSFYDVTSAKLTDPKDGHLIPFPDDFLAWIQSDPDFAAVAATPVTVAGLAGLQIDATPIWKSATSKLKLFLSLSGDITRNLEGQPDGENIVRDAEQWRFTLLNNVNGERLLLILVDGNEHDFQDAVTQTQAVVNTVSFGKPSAAATVAPTTGLTVFSAQRFGLPLSVSLGAAWSVAEEDTDVVTLVTTENYVDTAFIIVKDASIAGPQTPFATAAFPADFVTWIQAHGLFHVTATTPVVIGGFHGIQISANATADCGAKRDWLFLKSTGWNCRQGEYYRFVYLNDVNGQQVLILNTGGDDLSAADFKAGTDASQKVLDTVSFGQSAAAAAPKLVEYKLPTAASEPGGLVTGPDGALWFVETAVNKIGRISTAGAVTEYPVPTTGAIDPDQGFLAVGPDGALWFNEDVVNQIGRITTAGQVTEFKLPAELKPTQDDAPIRAIVAGPDGALWVTSPGANAIVRLTLEGKLAAKFALPKAGSNPVGLVMGPDGAFWFVETGVNQIGRMTLDGKLTEYALPADSKALRLTVGPDKALWFTMFTANKIGRISTDGKLTLFDAAGMGPVGITSGPDGALWFTGYASTEIGRLTTDGRLTRLAVPTADSVPYHITAGSDGNLWFTEQQGNQIGHIQLTAP